MPFGPTNRPATFINFIHDIDSVWKEEAQQQGVTDLGRMANLRLVDKQGKELVELKLQVCVCVCLLDLQGRGDTGHSHL